MKIIMQKYKFFLIERNPYKIINFTPSSRVEILRVQFQGCSADAKATRGV